MKAKAKGSKEAVVQTLAQVMVSALDELGYKADDDMEPLTWREIMDHGTKNIKAGRKDITGADTATYVHGPGGMFSSAGIDNVVVNASMTPMDLDSMLPVYPTIYMNPLFPTLVGFEENVGDEPDGECDSCLGGIMKGCNLTAAFGHICRGTNEIHIIRTIQMINRGETTPLTLLGDVLGPEGISKIPSTPSDWLEVTTRSEMVVAAVLAQRKIMRMTWNGSPTRNSANGGYKEFPGLEMLVGTGKVDAESGTTCDALDSLVMDFGSQDVSYTTVAGVDIVQYLSTMEWYLRYVAERTGMMPVNWVVCMTPDLWFELTAIWACRYLTNRCSAANATAGQTPVILNDDTAVRLRDAMRDNMTITINGRNYPVITCNGMTEIQGGDPGKANWDSDLQPGQFESSIFFLPLSIRGGMKTLYWEHLDYSKLDDQIGLTRSMNNFWTDGGRWLWSAERKKGCFKLNAEIDLRIILRAPQLAGRLDNIIYSPLQHMRGITSKDPYGKGGGVNIRNTGANSWYSEWHPGGPD